MIITKKPFLIFFVTLLCFCVGVSYASWKYNPFTEYLDYYEQGTCTCSDDYVNTTGDTMTGDLYLKESTPRLYFNDTDTANGQLWFESSDNTLHLWGKSGALSWIISSWVMSGNKMCIGCVTGNPSANLDVQGDTNITGYVHAEDYYSGENNQGMTDSTSYWLCTADDCSTTCQAVIEDGLIVDCDGGLG